MKKLLACLLIAVMVMTTFAGCNGSKTESDSFENSDSRENPNENSNGSSNGNDESKESDKKQDGETVCNHTGGTATCKTQAVCTACGQSYGELDADNHTKGTAWITSKTKHKKIYLCCEAVAIEERDHKLESGICTECGYGCSHTGGTATCKTLAKCTDCGHSYGALKADNHEGAAEWTKTAMTHTKVYTCCQTVVVATASHKWTNGVCTECGYGCSHTGGTATCKTLAQCTDCGHSYGSLNKNNHTETAEWTKTATTHTKAYTCCGAVLEATENHKWSGESCSECGHKCTHTWDGNNCSYCGVQKYSQGLSYALDTSTDTYKVIGLGTCADTDVIIPSTYNGKAVTRIEDDAFDYESTLTSITIGNNVTSIGYKAFYNCSRIKNVIFDENSKLSFIDKYAFSDCSRLKSIVIPNGVTSIEERVFSSCTELTSVNIPTNATSIGNYAFYNCDGLTSIEIPNSVTSIGSSAFSSCSGLASITLPFVGATLNGNSNTCFGYIFGASSYSGNSSNVPTSLKTVVITGGTSIGNYAFYNCDGLTSIEIPNTVTSIGDEVFYNCSGLTSIEIPNSVTSIGDKLFYNCSSLISIEMPNSVTSIGDEVFYNCSSLTSIEIPNSVTSIGEWAFYNCSSLTSITIPTNVTSIGRHAFYNCSKLASIMLPFVGATKDGTSNTHFGYIFGASDDSFNDDYVPASLKTVVITGGTSIGESAFSRCSSLTSIKIPTNVTSISSYSFYNCSSLISIEIPTNVTSIGEWAFYNCSSLTSITIPSSVTTVDYKAFGSCTGITSVYYDGNVETWCGITWETNSNPLTNKSNLYFKNESDEYELVTEIILPDTITSINDDAFNGCISLISITIPNSVTYIGDDAFNCCTGLTSITIPSSVTHIGSYAFSGCTNLTKVTFKKTSGWYLYYNYSGFYLESTELSDLSNAAKCLTSTYKVFYWKRS